MKYLQYKPFFNIPDAPESTNVVAENMLIAQEIAFKNLNQYIKKNTTTNSNDDSENERNIKWLTNKLHSTKEEIIDILSPEQMDSVGFAIYNIENKSEFIVGDETGIGKGRILASICRYALSNNKNILFFTESSNLFSDFWRDLQDTNAIQFIDNIEAGPFLLHSSAKVYNMNSGELIYKSLSSKNLKDVISSGEFIKNVRGKQSNAKCNLMMTTYSQFNRILTAKNKISLLKNFINDDTIIIFDEFHNSIGDSFTNEMKEDIKKIGGTPIYSSATFLDDFKKINSFLNILDINKNDEKVINTIINSNNNLAFSNQLAFMMTKNNKLLRREHTKIDKINYVYLDDKTTKDLDIQLTMYKNIILKIFNCYKVVSKYKDDNIKNKWIAMGNIINRLTKILILTHKKDFLINRIEKSLKENEKCVIVLESTFDSLINTCIEYKNKLELKNVENLENLGVKLTDEELSKLLPENNEFSLDELSFKTLLLNMTNNLLLEYIEEIDNNQITNYFKDIISSIDSFPFVSLSLIDDIKSHFNTLEISGRNTSLNKVNHKYVLSNKKKVDKAIIVKQFNDGESDVIILTRSGSTGLSLHSSANFKDKRVRKMFELEITPRAKVRLQFFGRVKRRGQIHEPKFETIVSNTPFEKRIVSLEEKKLTKLRSFVGSDFEVNSLDFDYFNDFTNYLSKVYLIQNPDISMLLGIYPYTDEPMYHIDFLLKRSVLLENNIQEKIFNYLDSGNYVYNQLSVSYNSNILNKYTDNLFFTKVEPLISNLSPEDIDEYKKLTRQDMIDTNLPIVALASAYNDIKINSINKNELIEILNKNKNNFDYLEYNKNISFVNIKLDYGNNKKLVLDNLNKIKNIKIGSQIKFNINDNTYFGYIEDISYPSKMFDDYSLSQYITHYLFRIRIINPKNLSENNRISTDTICIMGSILLENNNFDVYNKEINFEKFERNNEVIRQNTYMLVGNVFYINFIHKVYNIGELVSFNKNINGYNKQIFSLKLPNNLDIKSIKEIFKFKPLFIPNHATKYISTGKIIKTIDDSIRMWKITGGDGKSDLWVLKIKKELYFNDKIINFKNKRLLEKIISKEDGEYIVFNFYEYKLFITILYSLFYNNDICLTSNY